ncbi:MAG TPA: DMT family protein [Bacteroidia bacterium]|nr:DMT family protein [Bacteroidia bacterium]
MRVFYTIVLLVLSNSFMTLAWYGHLKFKELNWFQNAGLITVVLISWGIALFEYFFQVPANRIGYEGNGGPFSLLQLKVLQEVITLIVFSAFIFLFFKNEALKLNHLISFVFIVLAVYFAYKK